MDGVVGNGETILSNVDCIIDTGTTLVVGDPLQVATFYSVLGGYDASSTLGEGYYTCMPQSSHFRHLIDTLRSPMRFLPFGELHLWGHIVPNLPRNPQRWASLC